MFSNRTLILIAVLLAADWPGYPQVNTEERRVPVSREWNWEGLSTSSDALFPLTDFNRRLPGWLRFDGEARDRMERFSGIGFHDRADNHDLTRWRLMMLIKPSRWLRFLAETQDSRVFGNVNVGSVPPYQNSLDVRQAYGQLGDASEGSFEIVAGRQMLSFGDERLIGPSDWSNMGRTFDVVRLDLHRSWFRLSLFASSVIIAREGVIDHHIQGNNLHGAYGSLQRVIPRATVEPYVFWRVAPAGLRLNENPGPGALSEVTVGARAVGDAPAGLEYDVEMMVQRGSAGPDSIRAWAGHWNLARRLPWRFQPRPFVEANYASGTDNPGGTERNTFDQLYPSSHEKLGFADQVGWRNIEQIRAGASETVGRRLKFTETWEDFWLASARDALYSTGGAPIARSATGAAGRHVGQEVDAWATWKWNEAIEFGFGYSRFLTGGFLNKTTQGHDFNYPWVYLAYQFTRSKSPPR
jgi:hypothetical protein